MSSAGHTENVDFTHYIKSKKRLSLLNNCLRKVIDMSSGHMATQKRSQSCLKYCCKWKKNNARGSSNHIRHTSNTDLTQNQVNKLKQWQTAMLPSHWQQGASNETLFISPEQWELTCPEGYNSSKSCLYQSWRFVCLCASYVYDTSVYLQCTSEKLLHIDNSKMSLNKTIKYLSITRNSWGYYICGILGTTEN